MNTGNDKTVVGFTRVKDQDAVIVIVNFWTKFQSIKLDTKDFSGKYKNVFTGNVEDVKALSDSSLQPWQYKVWKKQSSISFCILNKKANK